MWSALLGKFQPIVDNSAPKEPKQMWCLAALRPSTAYAAPDVAEQFRSPAQNGTIGLLAIPAA